MTEVRLEQWSVFDKGLAGVAYGHPMFPDGAAISTSALVSVRYRGDDLLATTRSGRVYRLGAVSPEYDKQCPGARQRLIAGYRGGSI